MNNIKINIPISNWLLGWFLLVDSQVHQKMQCLVTVSFLLKYVIKKQRGWAGSLRLEAGGWKKLFTSTQFGDSATILCNAENLSSSLEAFLACRLTSLDKNSGLRPIGVGKVLRRIAGKVISTHVGDFVVT